MDRLAWLLKIKRSMEDHYDTIYAPIYDDSWGVEIAPSHQQFIAKFINLCPPACYILDAACGTGKYWPAILDSGRIVFGIDQSEQMLLRAKIKRPDVEIKKMDLQEMSFENAFQGAICMDAMEFVFPEDWPLVLGNLFKAIKPNCYLYFTVEIAEKADIKTAFEKGREMGLPVVYGEWIHEGGYHYYPRIEQVKEWINQVGFHILEETHGDEYQHFLVRKVINN